MLLAALALLAAQDVALREGATFDAGGRTATLKRLDTLPYVDSEWSRRFRFDSAENPKLKELRERFKLDEVVAPGRDEFEKQLLLLDWAHARFPRFGRPTANPRGALEILKAIDEGHTFFCAQYAQVFASAAASLGWIDRTLALRRHRDTPRSGSSEHTSTEIWSNQHRKWIMMDPTAGMYVQKDGLPLNAFEIRLEWFTREGKDLVFVIGKDRRACRKGDLPVVLGRFEGFGDLTVPADEMEKYGFTGYIPNTDLMDAGPDYGKMFIVKDALCDGTKWHVRALPPDPAKDPYFPLGQAALSLTADGGALTVSLRTLTPNFKEFQVRLDGGPWTASPDRFPWILRPGPNRLEAKSVNRFGVEGPLSAAEVDVPR